MARTVPEDHDQRAAALEAALRVGTGVITDESGNFKSCTDGSIVVKNAELFLKFLKGE